MSANPLSPEIEEKIDALARAARKAPIVIGGELELDVARKSLEDYLLELIADRERLLAFAANVKRFEAYEGKCKVGFTAETLGIGIGFFREITDGLITASAPKGGE